MTRSASGGIVPSLNADDLVAGVPQLASVARLETMSLFGLPSPALTLTHLAQVAALLTSRFAASDLDGAVIVQGTDTIEDTAFVLDRLTDEHRPIVVTGAMRGPEAAGADGPANLLAAVTVAGSRQTAAAGVLVVMNDEIHAAQWVQKTHTSLTSAFASPGLGRIGLVVEGRVEMMSAITRRAGRIACASVLDRPVALVSLGMGEDGRILSALTALGYRGAVIEAMGAGHVPPTALDAITALAATMPVVLTTRVRAGFIFHDTYGFAGSERDLIARGVIPAGHLTPSKARLLLSLLLSAGSGVDEIRSAFGST